MRGRKAPVLTLVDGGLARIPAAPEWLPAAAKAKWRQLAPLLAKSRTIRRSDLPALESFCLAWGTMESAQRTIAAEGEYVDSAHGKKRHPAFQTMFQSLAEVRRLGAELGLSPASRSKAPVLDGDDDDLAGMDF